MSKLVVLLCVLSLGTGCSYGPFHITHKYGSMPKGHISIPYDGKLRVLAVDHYKIDGVKVVWKRKFK